MSRAFKLATTWRWDRLFDSFDFENQPLAVHEAHCIIMVSFVCTCRPVLVHPPVNA